MVIWFEEATGRRRGRDESESPRTKSGSIKDQKRLDDKTQLEASAQSSSHSVVELSEVSVAALARHNSLSNSRSRSLSTGLASTFPPIQAETGIRAQSSDPIREYSSLSAKVWPLQTVI